MEIKFMIKENCAVIVTFSITVNPLFAIPTALICGAFTFSAIAPTSKVSNSEHFRLSPVLLENQLGLAYSKRDYLFSCLHLRNNFGISKHNQSF
jgi:hypothetical protein